MYNILKNDEYPLEEFGGPLTEPLGSYTPYNFRALINYCEERVLFEIKSVNDELKKFEL